MELNLIVDNRVRFCVAGVDRQTLSEVKRLFEHKNPEHAKKKRLGLPTYNEPREIRTWLEGKGEDGAPWLSLPRGGMSRVRDALTDRGYDVRVTDAREHGVPAELPDHKRELYAHQERIVEAAIEREQGLIRSGTGCLVGTTMIGVNRARKGSKMPLAHVVKMFNGGISFNRRWDADIPTFVRAPFPDGTVRLAKLSAAVESGIKPVYRLDLEGGHRVVGTEDHRVLTPFGWIPMIELWGKVDWVLVDGGIPKGTSHARKLHVEEHKRHLESRLVPKRVVGFDFAGERMTYDLTIEGVSAFTANDVAVHNSGKTSAFIAIAARLSVPTLVVVHSRALYDQWADRLVSELGLRPRQIGSVRGGSYRLKPITIGVWKSVEKAAADPEFRRYFGCLMMDEVHLAAAKSFFGAIDPMPARYRFGASADERRKDRKEFLIHDLFGDVLVDVKRDELIKSGHVLDVEVRAVPTTFSASWYGVPVEDSADEKELNFVRLVKEMAEDPARNWQAVRLIRDEVAEGNQVLVMAHEREHCMRLGQIVAGMGTPTGYLLGGQESREEFRRTCAGLKSGKVRVGVGTYKAIGTGIDLPMIGVAVAVTPIAGNQQFFGQVRGRVCRTSVGKTGARLYVLLDDHVYPRHLKNLSAWNANVFVRDAAGTWVPARQWLVSA